MTNETKRRNLLLASLRYLQAAVIRAQENSGQPDDFTIIPVFKESIAQILRDGGDGNNTITFADAKELIDELCVEINCDPHIVWVEVDGGCVQAVYGPKHLEVRLIDNDNGEVDEVAAEENKAEEKLLKKAKAAGLVEELL